MRLTVDASVFVAAARAHEPNHPASRQFVERVRRSAIALRCPSLLLVECSAALARTTGDIALARQLVALVEALPGMRFVSLNRSAARRASATAAAHRLRGGDAVYAAVASQARAVLITWNEEMLTRASSLVTTMTPLDWLTTHGP